MTSRLKSAACVVSDANRIEQRSATTESRRESFNMRNTSVVSYLVIPQSCQGFERLKLMLTLREGSSRCHPNPVDSVNPEILSNRMTRFAGFTRYLYFHRKQSHRRARPVRVCNDLIIA